MLRYGKGQAVWTIEQAGATITTTLDGVATTETLPSDLIATKRFDILLKKQMREGWSRIKEAAKPAAARATQVAVPVVEDARNLELEAMILEDPSAENFRMYADWLEQQGDPRGHAIALSLQREIDPSDTKLDLMTKAYFSRIHGYLHKGVVAGVGRYVEMKRSYVDEISYYEGDLAAQLIETLAASSGRFVQRIRLDTERESLQGALEVVATAPATLRELRIGGNTTLEHLDPIVGRLPALTEFGLFTIYDRSFVVMPRVIEQLVAAPLPMLERLHLDLSSNITAAMVQPLFQRTDLSKLADIGIRTSIDADMLRMLADSPSAPQLRTLRVENFGFAEYNVWPQIASKFPVLELLEVPTGIFDDDERDEAIKRRLTIEERYGWGREVHLSTSPRHRDDDDNDDDNYDDVQE